MARKAPSTPGERPLAIIVVGASGNLARKKIYPALFALFCQGFLPADFRVYGFSRTALDHAAFRGRIQENLTCRYAPAENCGARMDEFLGRCFYQAGEYGAAESFLDLFALIRETSGHPDANCVWDLAIPPSLFLEVSRAIGAAGLAGCDRRGPWSRVVIEKPFGRDRSSSDALMRDLGEVFAEEQTYRIDHYLGKELIRNLLVLRFGNLVFQSLWHRRFIESVSISWREDLGVDGRGGYFDEYGIVRDVMQNHLLQILALVAMEAPRRLEADGIRDAKVRVLRAIPPLGRSEVVIGQYGPGAHRGRAHPGYLEDPTVAQGSRTATYAAAVLRVETPRWRGVPFLLEAGKGLSARRTEIRIRFREAPGALFAPPEGGGANELLLVVQPDEAIRLRLLSKAPGLGFAVAARDLDLTYQEAFADRPIPDAYERLLLDAIVGGDRSLFLRSDELAAAWDVFTPVLHRIDRETGRPEPYPFGSDGPEAGRALLQAHGLPD